MARKEKKTTEEVQPSETSPESTVAADIDNANDAAASPEATSEASVSSIDEQTAITNFEAARDLWTQQSLIVLELRKQCLEMLKLSIMDDHRRQMIKFRVTDYIPDLMPVETREKFDARREELNHSRETEEGNLRIAKEAVEEIMEIIDREFPSNRETECQQQ